MSKKLGVIKYKNFEFPYNPRTSTFKCSRSYVQHRYPESYGAELEDFGRDAIVITGSGEFVGEDAYTTFNKLRKEFSKRNVGPVSHPVFKSITRGLMTELTGELEENNENYIKYTFEIVADTRPTTSEYLKNFNKKKKKSSNSSKNSSKKKNGSNYIIYIVKKGDTLSQICYTYSKKHNTTINWKEIAKLNNLKNPNIIYPGQKIKIKW